MGLWTVAVAQLVERSLLTPEIGCSNPNIGKILSANYIIEKTNIKKQRQEWPIFKKKHFGTCRSLQKVTRVYQPRVLSRLVLRKLH